MFCPDGTYAQAVPALSTPWRAAAAPAPRLCILNEGLAVELGLDPAALRTPDGVALLTGAVPASVPTTAQVYAGHQFGGFSPRLGDGRALLLGELIDTSGRRRDLHLKGSGRTPYARGGDGWAVLGPMLREYLIGEAMHALGIPSTRALSVVSTGQKVMRERWLPGAVLCRVADSHLRVGTFQYAATTGDPQVLRALADYAIARHYPEVAESDAEPGSPGNRYLAFLSRVIDAQARLVAGWMQVGFVHGVMNTDNMTISGQTIDYGPCAFLDGYHPSTVFSSIDHGGRYAYGNQPAAAQWNLARLAETLLPLIDERPDAAVEAATAALHRFADIYLSAYQSGMAAKLGIPPDHPDLPRLVEDLLSVMADQRVDYPGFFRALAAGTARALFTDPAPYDAWSTRRDQVLTATGAETAVVTAAMNRVNPVYIPRNHQVEAALNAAVEGDLRPVERLVEAVSRPYDERPGLEDLAAPPPAGTPPCVTFCGT